MHTLHVPGVTNRICLIDTPGFDDTNRSDADILQEVAFWLVRSYKLGIRLSGIIYLHRIIDVRLGGSAVRSLNVFKAMCGTENFHGVTMATTFWDKVEDFDKAREDKDELLRNPHFWKELADGNCTIRSLTAGKSSAIELVTAIAHSGKQLVLNMQYQLVEEKLPIYETDAGLVLQESWFQEKSDLHSKLMETRRQLTAALATNKADRQIYLQQHCKELSTRIIQRNAAMKDLTQSIEVITDTWAKKAADVLELRKKQYKDAQSRLKRATTSLNLVPSNSLEYVKKQREVDKLFKEKEVADRLQNIQIASYSLKLNEASLATAIVSGIGSMISAGVAVVPFIPIIAACNVM
ncbi:uncharacterized protein EKO05_0011162 [Ascochyta rabiei]|nr:uncharacterized protein EKO05_0011162 [Ascochyta rabiei]UPX20954.1 hypothetical protein EKO05_0011162 [Ascochyta rabiei]